MNLNDVYQSDTLKAADLKGREHLLVIATIDVKPFNDGPKLILTFQNAKKSFVCNRTNAKRIAFRHGDDTDGWIGKEIILYPDLVDFQGKAVEAIRVKPAPERTQHVAKPVVQKRDGYELSTTIHSGERHPNAPADMGDQEIPF